MDYLLKENCHQEFEQQLQPLPQLREELVDENYNYNSSFHQTQQHQIVLNKSNVNNVTNVDYIKKEPIDIENEEFHNYIDDDEDDFISEVTENCNIKCGEILISKLNNGFTFNCSLCNKHFNNFGEFSEHAICHNFNNIQNSLNKGKKMFNLKKTIKNEIKINNNNNKLSNSIVVPPTVSSKDPIRIASTNLSNANNNENRDYINKLDLINILPEIELIKFEKANDEGNSLMDFKLNTLDFGKKKLYQCSHCPKSFTRQYALTNHENIHTGNSRFICGRCKKSFTTSHCMRKHSIRCKFIKSVVYPCKTCNRIFPTKNFLDVHMNESHSSNYNTNRNIRQSSLNQNNINISNNMENNILIQKSENAPTFANFIGKSLYKKTFEENPSKIFYNCNQCNKFFSRIDIYQLHMKSHEYKVNGRKFKCKFCGKLYTRNAYKIWHERKCKLLPNNSNNKLKKCLKCEKILISGIESNSHVCNNNNNSDNTDVITVKKNAYIESKINDKLKSKSPERRFACHLCDKKFLISGYLNYHISKFHNQNEIFDVDNNAKEDKNEGSLNTNDNKQDAGKTEKNTETLSTYVKRAAETHRDDNNGIPCELCILIFPKIDLLMTHYVKMHHIQFPEYSTRDNFNRLINKEINNIPSQFNKCKFCNEIFMSGNELEIHLRTHVDVPIKTTPQSLFQCKKCGLNFNHKFSLSVHEDSHNQNICYICNKVFVLPKYLQQHIINVHHQSEASSMDCNKSSTNPKLFTCSICPASYQKSYYLKIHKSLHRKKNLYKCVKCLKCFVAKDRLLLHKAMKHSKLLKGVSKTKLKKTDPSLKINLLAFLSQPLLSSFSCKICSKEFLSEFILQNHYRLCHKNHALSLFSNNGIFDMENNEINILNNNDVYPIISQAKQSHSNQQCVEPSNVIGKILKNMLQPKVTEKQELAPRIKRIVKSSNEFKCKKCQQIFVNRSLLASHFRLKMCQEQGKIQEKLTHEAANLVINKQISIAKASKKFNLSEFAIKRVLKLKRATLEKPVDQNSIQNNVNPNLKHSLKDSLENVIKAIELYKRGEINETECYEKYNLSKSILLSFTKHVIHKPSTDNLIDIATNNTETSNTAETKSYENSSTLTVDIHDLLQDNNFHQSMCGKYNISKSTLLWYMKCYYEQGTLIENIKLKSINIENKSSTEFKEKNTVASTSIISDINQTKFNPRSKYAIKGTMEYKNLQYALDDYRNGLPKSEICRKYKICLRTFNRYLNGIKFGDVIKNENTVLKVSESPFSRNMGNTSKTILNEGDKNDNFENNAFSSFNPLVNTAVNEQCKINTVQLFEQPNENENNFNTSINNIDLSASNNFLTTESIEAFGKSNPKNYSIDGTPERDNLLKAINEYRIGSISQLNVSRKYNISIATFAKYWKKNLESGNIDFSGLHLNNDHTYAGSSSYIREEQNSIAQMETLTASLTSTQPHNTNFIAPIEQLQSLQPNFFITQDPNINNFEYFNNAHCATPQELYPNTVAKEYNINPINTIPYSIQSHNSAAIYNENIKKTINNNKQELIITKSNFRHNDILKAIKEYRNGCGGLSQAETCKKYDVSLSTFQRHLKKQTKANII